MRLNRVHVPPALASGGEISLPEAAAYHVARVLRLRPGAPLVLFDGSGSDFRGEIVAVDGDRVSVLVGERAPGPDYQLYLSPQFVETEAEFNRLKPAMARVGEVRTFRNFLVTVPESVDIERYNTVIVWCESFGQFITAAQYR